MRHYLALAMSCICVSVSAVHAESAMVAYSRSGGGGLPRYRTWTGAAWTSEASANGVGSDPQWVVLRGSPINNQFALATLDNDVDVDVQIWNGTSWGAVSNATADAGDRTTRVFDLAYEQVSGHLLLVYRESGTSSMRFRTHNGTSWSAESSYSITGGAIKWLQLTPKKGTDEIMLIALSDQDNNLSRAAVWNGSSFTNQVLMPTDDNDVEVAYQHAAGAFEASSGQGLVAFFKNSDTPGYRTLTGGAWSGQLNAADIGGEPRWINLTSDPFSDEIVMATMDHKRDINLTVWNGGSWGSAFQIEKKTGDVKALGMHMAYEPDGAEALIVYDDNTNVLNYRRWDGFGWTSELPGPSGGSSPIWNPRVVSGLGSSEIFAIWATNDPQIRIALWNGSSFGTATVLATSGAPKEYEAFMVAIAGMGVLPQLTNWTEIQP